MMRDNQINQLLIILFGLMLVVGTLGVGIFYFGSVFADSIEDTETTVVKVEDITDLPDEFDTTGGEDGGEDDEGDIPDPEVGEEDEDDITVIETPSGDDGEPKTFDHSFKGVIKVTAQLLDEAGNPLNIALDFTKDPVSNEMDIDKIKIKYEWDFELGEDLDPSSFKINVKGRIKKIYWRDLVDTYRTGTINGQTIFDATGFDPKGHDTQTFDIEDSKLRFNDIESAGVEKALLYTTSKSFIIEWEAIISTKGGTLKRITGETGISLNLYYVDRDTNYGTPPDTDPNVRDWLNLPSDYNPYDPSPLMSVVAIR